MTDATREALALLRDSSHVSWSVVAFLGLVLYVYAVEVERRRWDVVAAGLAFVLFDVFNELVNSATLHISDTAPLWAVTGPTSYLILVGWCIEILFLFAISGIVFVKFLPADRTLRVLGIPNRWFFTVMWSCVSVVVEVLLHRAGIFHWHYSWWGEGWGLIPIVVFGYATFFATAAAVFDMASDRRRFTVVGAMAGVDLALAVAFGFAGWL
jgi:hypothetical protein